MPTQATWSSLRKLTGNSDERVVWHSILNSASTDWGKLTLTRMTSQSGQPFAPNRLTKPFAIPDFKRSCDNLIQNQQLRIGWQPSPRRRPVHYLQFSIPRSSTLVSTDMPPCPCPLQVPMDILESVGDLKQENNGCPPTIITANRTLARFPFNTA